MNRSPRNYAFALLLLLIRAVGVGRALEWEWMPRAASLVLSPWRKRGGARLHLRPLGPDNLRIRADTLFLQTPIPHRRTTRRESGWKALALSDGGCLCWGRTGAALPGGVTRACGAPSVIGAMSQPKRERPTQTSTACATLHQRRYRLTGTSSADAAPSAGPSPFPGVSDECASWQCARDRKTRRPRQRCRTHVRR